MEQLEVYAALFCLEYKIKPSDIDMELRIYQNDQILYHNPTAEDIVPIMDKIVHLNNLLEKIDYEESWSWILLQKRLCHILVEA